MSRSVSGFFISIYADYSALHREGKIHGINIVCGPRLMEARNQILQQDLGKWSLRFWFQQNNISRTEDALREISARIRRKRIFGKRRNITVFPALRLGRGHRTELRDGTDIAQGEAQEKARTVQEKFHWKNHRMRYYNRSKEWADEASRRGRKVARTASVFCPASHGCFS